MRVYHFLDSVYTNVYTIDIESREVEMTNIFEATQARVEKRAKFELLQAEIKELSKNHAIISPSGLVSPSLNSIRKYDDAANSARYCKSCGASDVFDGVMFTVDSTRRSCDDCYG